MTNKARLSSLANQLGKAKAEASTGPVANPPHGQKGDFIKLTATLSPDVYQLLMKEVTRRKVAKEPNPQISAILREAVIKYLG